MSLRTKILISISAVMVLVVLLLTLNLWADALARNQREMSRKREFLTRLISDWLAQEQALQKAHSRTAWGIVGMKMAGSTLFSEWAVVGQVENGLKIYTSSSPDHGAILRRDGEYLSAVLAGKLPHFQENRAYFRIKTVHGEAFAVGMTLAAPALASIDVSETMAGIFWIMGLGTALLLLVTFMLVQRFLLRPISAMVDASTRIAAGDFGTPIREEWGHDEMARMTEAFNLMMHKIADSHRTMRQDIRRARTRITETEKRLFAAQRLSTTGTLAAGIAHEIGNPLGGMINAARALRNTNMSEGKRGEYYDLLEEGLLRVRDIVAQVLQFSPRLLEPAPVNVKKMMDHAVAFLEHRLKAKDVSVEGRLLNELPPVQGDALELQQAFLNLLMNAVDAVESGSGKITISGEVSGNVVRLCISDNGCGMSEEEIQRCLDPFYTTKEVGQGTGLGLSVAHNIIKNHDGRIEISGVKGEGTNVTVFLPANAAPDPGRPEQPMVTDRRNG